MDELELVQKLRRAIRELSRIGNRIEDMKTRADNCEEYREKIGPEWRHLVKKKAKKGSLFAQVKIGGLVAIFFLVLAIIQLAENLKGGVFAFLVSVVVCIGCAIVAATAAWRLWEYRKEADEALSKRIVKRILEHNDGVLKARAKKKAAAERARRESERQNVVIPPEGFAPPPAP